ncbi:MAG: hypothetical protein GF317_06535 [Candidatus Lokiarchaeota archaeon]|nr:hypothetical protein [Candidatus Lokiarchaeota archaeon]MBD3199370.1 hypothetical protein [Candidatus Lokiarchaeota archaeon]
MKCPSCDVEMEPLVEGIFQCPKCRKIVKSKEETIEEQEAAQIEEGGFQDGEYFHNHASINKQYEICEKGITINKTDSRWFSVLICHSAYLKTERYIRLSWWKKSFYRHAGMMKIYNAEVLNNLVKALQKIDDDFDEFWTFHGKFREDKSQSEEDKLREEKLDLIKYRIIENRTCPSCQNRMDKKKSHYECTNCGEIVILEGYNQPVFNINASDLKLNFQASFPINFYLPVSGITIKWLMGEWKALAVIYSKDNPNKKWLRFYWWTRDLKNVMKYGYRDIGGDSTKMGWKAKAGSGTTNLYNKDLIKPLIQALKKTGKELGWNLQEKESE